jgi:hypothetical protein
VILNNPLWRDVIGFLLANQSTPRPALDLSIAIEKRLGKTWSSSMQKTVVDSLVSILEFAELVKAESGNIISLIGPGVGPEPSNFNLNLPKGTYTSDRYGLTTTIGPATERAAISDFYEFKDEGVYIRIRKDDQSVALAKDLVDLFAKRHQSGLKTTKVEEAPGTS